ncbi:FecR family protein [Steroidobacter sp.]|uniref:FecR family protein n=1 Tax=Steroidobacter sp. TaxID=1978227 RepID=UPI001A3D5CEE|nr:FecR domain-containing protein [Steroidobacter sp.]MBL8267677.1 FecR domain-containing protein [Steroidobacter sp.]
MNPTSEPPSATIRQAIEWHQRLKQGELEPTTQRELNAWLQSRANVEELARICLLDTLLGRDSLKKISLDSLPENVVPFELYAPAPSRVSAVPTRRMLPRLTAKVAIAAGLVLSVIVAAIISLASTDRVIVTREGRWDKQLLEDGSVVYAGPRTKLHFHFDDELRAVTLVRGEALFEVAHQPERPFIVSTEVGSVQAIGTSFATTDLGDRVVVTVAEGKVAVTSAAGVQPILPVHANQRVVLSAAGAGLPEPVNAERAVKWIRNWYEYDGERVGEIVAELNRRHATKVVVDDPQVARLRMNALSFRPSQPEDFVAQINRWYLDFPQKSGPHKAAGDRRSHGVLHLQRS